MENHRSSGNWETDKEKVAGGGGCGDREPLTGGNIGHRTNVSA